MNEYAYYKNGTIHTTFFAKNLKEAKKECNATFGKDCEVVLHNTSKELLISWVISEIEKDINCGDTESLHYMLNSLSKKTLMAYLPEKENNKNRIEL